MYGVQKGSNGGSLRRSEEGGDQRVVTGTGQQRQSHSSKRGNGGGSRSVTTREITNSEKSEKVEGGKLENKKTLEYSFYRMTDEAAGKFLNGDLGGVDFSNLYELALEGIKEQKVKILAKVFDVCRNLGVLRLPQLIKGKELVEALERSKVSALNTLKKLCIRNCWRIDDDAYARLLKICPNIDELRLSGTNSIGKNELWSALEKNGVKSLPKVEQLVIFEGFRVADLAVMALINLCPNVKRIYLSGSDFTGGTFSEIIKAKGIKQRDKVETLELIDCWKLESEGIDALLDLFPNLNMISYRNPSSISYCGNIRTGILKRLYGFTIVGMDFGSFSLMNKTLLTKENLLNMLLIH